MLKRGQRGFTLIELLVVVAILGVLAAVVIPNMGRFLGAGKSEAKKTELQNVQAAVSMMMVDNNLGLLQTPVTVLTDDMELFPDTTAAASKVGGTGTWAIGDKAGWVLYQHDRVGDSVQTGLANYVTTKRTACKYTVIADGTVTQDPAC